MKAAGIEVEPYWPSLFAKLFAKKSMDDLITNVGAGAQPGELWIGWELGLKHSMHSHDVCARRCSAGRSSSRSSNTNSAAKTQ